MLNRNKQESSIDLRGHKFTIETGAWARQANGSAVIRWNKMVLMANATMAKSANEALDFFPLTVEYREKFYATGRIPGGYIKREARPSEKEILTSRLTDRPLRPLFPETFLNETQIFVTLLSADGLMPSDVFSITAASAALMISDIPFSEPVAGVRVGRKDGNFILFPDNKEQEECDLNLVLAGTAGAVTMIEGHASEVSEEVMIEAIKAGHAEIRRLCDLQLDLRAKAGKTRMEPPVRPDHSEIRAKVREMGLSAMKEANASGDKKTRQANIDKVMSDLQEKVKAMFAELPAEEAEVRLKAAKSAIADLEVDVVRDQIFGAGIRADGRKLDEIRPIEIEIGVLPGVHGSAMFTRGETQSLGVVTLGTATDSQMIDDVEGEKHSHFYLHYNFPPYSVGEVRRLSGPGRRETGHGKLAENALRALIPPQEKFPYVIRIVSEILESNGSSSMATVCSGSLALMEAGVPVERAVAGVAMGLITSGSEFAVLSDIAGLEDHFGDMDFKVAGTEKGITAFQLDLKINGISYDVMEKALAQAKKGRMEILAKMNSVIAASRSELSDNAPRITTITIDKERIGELIGPGGKNIRAIIEQSGAEIDINDDGTVNIASNNADSARIARSLIEGQFADAEVDKVYDGVVKKLADFGAFIEIMPGKIGLCHISKLSSQRVTNVSDVVAVGDKVQVRVLAVDRTGKINLSIKDV